MTPSTKSRKTKAHIRYKLADGTLVPGVTTVIGILAKPALIPWAWGLGMKGIDYRKVRDQAADIGTIAHLMISSHWRGEEPNLEDYAKADIEKAETAFLAYLEWEADKEMEPIAIEEPLVSEIHKYGGTPDWYGLIGGKHTLLDFKTSKALYPEMRLQMAAYDELVAQEILTPEQHILLRIDKNSGEFVAHNIKLNGDEFLMFEHLLEVYRLQKKIWKKE